MLSHLVLKLQILDIFTLLLLLLFIIITVNLDFKEKIKEGFLFDFFGLFLPSFLFVFLLHDRYSNVLAWFPVDLISKAFLYDLIIELELFVNFGVCEPLVFREVEINPQLFEVLGFASLHFQ